MNRIITVLRKPLETTVARTVLEHGTGGLNIDASRIEGEGAMTKHSKSSGSDRSSREGNKPTGVWVEHEGRWPANVILTERAVAGMPDTGKSPKTYVRNVASGNKQVFGQGIGDPEGSVSRNYRDGGSAARFFFVVPDED